MRSAFCRAAMMRRPPMNELRHSRLDPTWLGRSPVMSRADVALLRRREQRRRVATDPNVGNLIAAAAQYRAELDRAQAVVHAGVLHDRLGDSNLTVMHRPGAGHAVRQALDAAPE